MLEVPLFFRENLRNKVIESLNQDGNLDDLVIDFLEKYNMFSNNSKTCKISRLPSPRENLSSALGRGITINQFSYPEDNIYELEVPVPIFTPLSNNPASDFTNSPIQLYKSRSVSHLDLYSDHLSQLSELMEDTPIFYSHILPPTKQKRGKKLFQYYWKGELEYDTFSLI